MNGKHFHRAAAPSPRAHLNGLAMSVEVRILVDNTAARDGLRGEHGLSMLISGPGKTVLFDAGAAGETLRTNAEKLGIDLSGLDTAVISHGHYDHTGGLVHVVQQCPGLNVYGSSGAFSRRWSDHPGRPLKDVSCPHSIEQLCGLGAVFHSVTHPEMLADWLVISGPIGGPKHGREVFVVRKAGEMVVDGFEDELCLLVRGHDGWIVLTGCCHRGLRNTLRTARFLVHDEPLTAIVGGLHLRSARPHELDEAVSLVDEYDVRNLYPCHCTGDAATEHLSRELPGRVHPLSAGSRVVF